MSLIVTCASAEALAQASFGMQNYYPPLDAPVYDWTGALLSGPDWRAEVYGGETPDSLTPVIGSNSRNAVMAPFVKPGYFRGGDYVVVVSVPELGWAWLQVKVWDVQLGATYEQALARGQGGYGQSTLFYAQGGGADVLQVPQPLIGLTSFSVLQPVPEVATWVLLAVGFGGLVWCRRR